MKKPRGKIPLKGSRDEKQSVFFISITFYKDVIFAEWCNVFIQNYKAWYRAHEQAFLSWLSMIGFFDDWINIDSAQQDFLIEEVSQKTYLEHMSYEISKNDGYHIWEDVERPFKLSFKHVWKIPE